MKLLYIYFTYNRPKVLADCLRTTLSNTKIFPNEIYILDDCSDLNIQSSLFKFAKENSSIEMPIHLILNGCNLGIGRQFESAYNLMRVLNPEFIFMVESDYVFRREYMEDCMAVIESNPNVVAIPLTSHPDFYNKEKTDNFFPKLMIQQFRKDIINREYMYKPFEIDTKRGKILVQGGSNSCGSCFLAYHRFNKILEDLNDQTRDVVSEYWQWMKIAFTKDEINNKKMANDAIMTCALTWYWYEWAKKNSLDLTKNFPWLDICDASIGQHLCIGGVNGNVPGMVEGQTFVGSPVWKTENFTRNI